jgi:hypothetical protein
LLRPIEGKGLTTSRSLSPSLLLLLLLLMTALLLMTTSTNEPADKMRAGGAVCSDG